MKVRSSSGWIVYRTYLALKAHYSREDYDFMKFNGIVKVSQSAYEKRNDKRMFEALGRKKDWINFLIPNIAYENMWIGEMLDVDTHNYTTFLKRKQAISYTIRSDLKKLPVSFKESCQIKDTPHPLIYQGFVQDDISLETISIVGHVTGLFSYWDKHMSDPLWQSDRLRILKHHVFLPYNKEKVLDIIRDLV